jgi:hypothetical protein
VDAFAEPSLPHATSPPQELCPARQSRILCCPYPVPLRCRKFAKSQAKLMVNLTSFSTFEAPGEFYIFSALDPSVTDPGCLFNLDPFFSHPRTWIPDFGSRIQQQ